MFFAGLLAASTASYAQTMTLHDCISAAVAGNLTLKNAELNVERGRTAVAQARARRLPVVNGTAGVTGYLLNPVNVTTGVLLGNDFPDDPTWQTIKSMPYNANIGASATLPLYDQTIRAATDAAKTVAELQSLSYEQAKEQLAVQVARTYRLAQASKGQMRLLDENILRMRQLCEITEAMLNEGVALEVDLSRAKVNLQNLQTERDRHATLHNQQLNLLRFLLNLPQENPIEVEDMEANYQSTMIGSVDVHLPELLIPAKQKETAERNIGIVRSAYKPTLSLTGYLGAIGYQERIDRFVHGHSAHANWFGNSFLSVSLKVPIYDGRRKHLQIRQYRYEAQQAANRTEQQHQQAETAYANALIQLQHDEAQLRTQQDNIRQAKDVYEVAEGQYREGVLTMALLLQDEMRLRQAEQAALQAHTQCLLTQVELLRLSGELYK